MFHAEAWSVQPLSVALVAHWGGPMIRVLMVDSHALVREGVSLILEKEADLSVIGQVGTGREAVASCRESKPDVVLVDYSLPDIDGLEVTRQCVALGTPQVLILTNLTNYEFAARALRAGASGYILKLDVPATLIAAVRKVANGGITVSPSLMDDVMSHMRDTKRTPETALSDRELQVLTALARGQSSREVATALCVSLSTVETHRSHIRAKLNLRNNSDITRFAIRRGLIEA